MKRKKTIMVFVTSVIMPYMLSAQPNIGLRPDKTVFFYTTDASVAAYAVKRDPVIAQSIETLALPIHNQTSSDLEENIDNSGSLSGVSEYARMDIYKPKSPNGKMVIICPGGAYALLATYNEGIYPADWMLRYGITVGVLKYRLPNGVWGAPLEDLHNALRYVRSHSEELDVKKVGVMGFSAGGHLAASGVVLYDDSATRPDFGILIYPVISMDSAITHLGSRYALLGNDSFWNDRAHHTVNEYYERLAKKDSLVFKYSCEKHVTPDTPPVFLALCSDDKIVNPQNSLRFYEACIENNVSAEIHIFKKGFHGWGFNLNEYNMKDPMEYCRAEFLNSLSRWIDGIDEMAGSDKGAVKSIMSMRENQQNPRP